jgi:RNase P subunit RPR2
MYMKDKQLSNICICDTSNVIEETAIRKGVTYKRNICRKCKSVHMTEKQLEYLIEETKRQSKTQDYTDT